MVINTKQISKQYAFHFAQTWRDETHRKIT